MDSELRREVLKFVETASVRQLEEKRVEVSVMKASLTDDDLIRTADWILGQIAREQWARIEAGTMTLDQVDPKIPNDQG